MKRVFIVLLLLVMICGCKKKEEEKYIKVDNIDFLEDQFFMQESSITLYCYGIYNKYICINSNIENDDNGTIVSTQVIDRGTYGYDKEKNTAYMTRTATVSSQWDPGAKRYGYAYFDSESTVQLPNLKKSIKEEGLYVHDGYKCSECIKLKIINDELNNEQKELLKKYVIMDFNPDTMGEFESTFPNTFKYLYDEKIYTK